ncbi:hypothetical protein EW145_g3761 [Phellinidium pouzarii]|uniref:DUF6533 domain-containing protein n=1 Tax=Phellinidium pouzarii TaxID=167371 RepID=A0A4S4L7U6_9AGAM|nr:hypothetical protein EW145_g3761 [Phellinidium pouzarii]
MDKEVKYFWRTPRNFVSCIYFLNRYIGIFSAFVYIPCNLAFWAKGITNLMTILFVDYILLMRVVALSFGDKKVSAFLRVLFCLNAASGLTLLIYGDIKDEIAVGSLIEGVNICGTNGAPFPALSALSWSIPLVYGFILMVLALYKAVMFWKTEGGFNGLGLVKIAVMDQAVYFFIVIFCAVVQIIAASTDSSVPLSVAFSVLGTPSILCILGSRLLVHLKEAGERGANEGTSFRTRNIESPRPVVMNEVARVLEAAETIY